MDVTEKGRRGGGGGGVREGGRKPCSVLLLWRKDAKSMWQVSFENVYSIPCMQAGRIDSGNGKGEGPQSCACWLPDFFPPNTFWLYFLFSFSFLHHSCFFLFFVFFSIFKSRFRLWFPFKARVCGGGIRGTGEEGGQGWGGSTSIATGARPGGQALGHV